MRHILGRIFDYQRFERSPDLQRTLDDTNARYGIPDDVLGRVTGGTDAREQRKNGLDLSPDLCYKPIVPENVRRGPAISGAEPYQQV